VSGFSVWLNLLQRRHWTVTWGHTRGWSPTAASSVARASYKHPSYEPISSITPVSQSVTAQPFPDVQTFV